MERTGVFAESLSTPECDGILDQLESGFAYIGERTLNLTMGMAELVAGDPDRFVDEINTRFRDLGNLAASVSKYSPLALVGVVANALPEGQVTDFLRRGAELQDHLRAETGRGLAEGLNPLQTPQTALKDLQEIGGDLGKVLSNLDDPASAGNEFLKLQQKWSGAGALTYMLTEEDPMVGLQKGLKAIHRQVEIVTTYGGPEGKVASAVLGVVMNESKKFIDHLNDPADKKAASALVGTFAIAFAQSMSDPNFSLDFDHPLHHAEIRSVDYQWMGNDHNSDGTYDWGLMHPVVEDKPGCISLGDYAYRGSIDRETLKAVCGVESGRNAWWSRPIDYDLVWGDNCSGATHDRSLWKPVCQDGYVGVGFVAADGSWQKPLPNRIACLKDDVRILTVLNGAQAGLQWVANDRGTGAKYDVTTYNRKFAGLDLMFAFPQAKSSDDAAFVQGLRIPVAFRLPGGLLPDAALPWGKETAYFFSGDHYTRYNLRADQADWGYPKGIGRGTWPGLGLATVDAALPWSNAKAYFFSGDVYTRYDIASDQADAGYPKKINSANWPGLGFETVDAAVNWGNGKVYFFSGDVYTRYDIASDQADAGYPKKVNSANWPGL